VMSVTVYFILDMIISAHRFLKKNLKEVSTDIAYYKRGVKFYNNKNYNEAINDFTHAINLRPDKSEYIGYRGFANFKKQSYEEAINDFNIAMMLGFKEPSYIKQFIGRSYLELKSYDLSVKNFTEAILLKPKDLDNYYFRGYAYDKER